MCQELLKNLKPEDYRFVDLAADLCNKSGSEAVLLLVGSRAAGYDTPWSDLDMWIIGDKRTLPVEQQRQHDLNGGLFMDRGDLEAHWHFYDKDYLTKRLAEWQSEIMWILTTAKYLHGSRETLLNLQQNYAAFPRPIAETKLKWLIGYFRTLPGPLFKLAGSGRTTGAFSLAGLAIDAICKICCVADCRPWPYHKWLTDVAGTTRLGQSLMPMVERFMELFLASPRPAPNKARDWSARNELKRIMETLPALLRESGWQGNWVDDPWEAVDETFKRSLP